MPICWKIQVISKRWHISIIILPHCSLLSLSFLVVFFFSIAIISTTIPDGLNSLILFFFRFKSNRVLTIHIFWKLLSHSDLSMVITTILRFIRDRTIFLILFFFIVWRLSPYRTESKVVWTVFWFPSLEVSKVKPPRCIVLFFSNRCYSCDSSIK